MGIYTKEDDVLKKEEVRRKGTEKKWANSIFDEIDIMAPFIRICASLSPNYKCFNINIIRLSNKNDE